MVRKMGDFEIIQRTQDGYFDANLLLHRWNKVPGHTKIKMEAFLSSPKTKEFIEVIKEREGNLHTQNSMYDVSNSLSGKSEKCHYLDNQHITKSKGRFETPPFLL
jgi:hypothetical protein